MATRVVLHPGLMKSGTSYLQKRLLANQSLLAERGLTIPGTWRQQVFAASDLLGRRPQDGVEGHWDRLLEQVAAAPDTVLFSMEFLAAATDEQVGRIVADLADVRLEVVLTVRDLGRNVPAMWQERIKNRGLSSWGTYLDSLEEADNLAAEIFWVQQSMGDITQRWVDALGADRVHLVTVPPPGASSELLWDRFCAAAGFDGSHAPASPTSNSSLSAPATQLLLQLNRATKEDLGHRDFHRQVKFGLAKHRLAEIPGPGIGFDPPRWLTRHAKKEIRRLRRSRATVHGDLDDLTPRIVEGVDPDQLDPQDVVDVSVAAMRLLVLQGRLNLVAPRPELAEGRAVPVPYDERVFSAPGEHDDTDHDDEDDDDLVSDD